jgi:hypothetical protein
MKRHFVQNWKRGIYFYPKMAKNHVIFQLYRKYLPKTLEKPYIPFNGFSETEFRKIKMMMQNRSVRARKTWVELLSYCILTLGTLGDYISTHIGLTYENLRETNPITNQLMANLMWLPANLFIVILGIAIPFLIIRFSKEDYYRCMLSFPITYGIVRLSACIWNISLII